MGWALRGGFDRLGEGGAIFCVFLLHAVNFEHFGRFAELGIEEWRIGGQACRS